MDSQYELFVICEPCKAVWHNQHITFTHTKVSVSQIMISPTLYSQLIYLFGCFVLFTSTNENAVCNMLATSLSLGLWFKGAFIFTQRQWGVQCHYNLQVYSPKQKTKFKTRFPLNWLHEPSRRLRHHAVVVQGHCCKLESVYIL